ncbi:conserved hypothetical protein [Talaromyces stipitatus ATCC 10500]|uniref:G domain-containing protein n=1 Tax=Talaromyces stipitatus (strain ATCC 10500 / CBS 375.48 / QM 6759 / NRRL 1006) TaxID=441959 RepID=B8M511_TALSN|nr:uncharacterized protein TSTA_028980 [Talaromyces stipitatus ATCC 10500]EED19617.1 conserved hypothetical protein [Talaromyces stipitatus ATCC 10500]
MAGSMYHSQTKDRYSSIPPRYEDITMADDPAPVTITANDIVIAVMGVTGAGKSTFISYFCPTARAGEGLESFTRSVEAHEADIDDQRVILIDTPGFDDTHRTETAVLREVAAWLNRSYEANIKLAGIIYLHRINDNRLGGAALRNLRMFKQLCGEDRLSCVVLGTTMWGLVPVNTAIKREIELKQNEEFWAGMIRKGSKVFRQDNGLVSALAIIRFILSKRSRDAPGGVTLQIQEEMARGATLDETAAGREVNAEIDRLRSQHKQELRDLRAEFEEAQKLNDAHYREELLRVKADVEKKMKEERDDRERMRVTWEQLKKQRDEELQLERQKAYELELEHRETILKKEAELDGLKSRNDLEAELIKERLMKDLEKAKAERYREQLRRLHTPCVVM